MDSHLIIDYFLALFTAISALAACGACVVTAWGYHSTNRPDVIVYLETDQASDAIYLCVGNFGNRAAHNVAVSLSEIPLFEDELDRKCMASFLREGIAALPPRTTKRTLAGTMNDAAYNDASKEYVASVAYSRKRNSHKKIREEYSLDYRSFCEALYMETEAYF